MCQNIKTQYTGAHLKISAHCAIRKMNTSRVFEHGDTPYSQKRSTAPFGNTPYWSEECSRMEPALLGNTPYWSKKCSRARSSPSLDDTHC